MKKEKVKISNDSNKDTTTIPAVIATISNKQIQVLQEGRIISCLTPGALLSHKNALVVGDQVEICPVGNGQYKLGNILSRETALFRGDRRSPGEEILVASNVEYLLVVVTADYLLNQAGFPVAAMIAANRAGIETGLLISKWDLVGERAQALLRDKLELYREIADSVFAGSFHEVKVELLQTIKGKTTVLIGDRVCGKTTLIQRILGALQGNDTCCGNMTNTHSSQLHAGPEETILIDTPGFRDLALHEVTEEERNLVFPEMARLAEKCRYSNCTHVHEDGCQVIDALRNNEIRKERYQAYQKMAVTASESKSKKSSGPEVDYRHTACAESFVCKVCGTLVAPGGAGSQHRNHCPKCLSSVHVDYEPGDRASLCNGIMDPVSVWVRKGGEWAVIHRCRLCGTFSSNRIAADDNPMLLMSIAVRPLSMPAFPLNDLSSL